MFRIILLVCIITLQFLFAYSAHCVVKYFNSDSTTEFDINVNNKVLTSYTSWGTYKNYYEGKKNIGYYYYSIDQNGFEGHTYIGTIFDGKMSYYSVADDGYGFKGTCTVK